MVESNGDYREEAFLEEHIGGPLYENQKELPRLPVPTIEDTLARFLPTALPLVKSEDEKKALLAACETFPEQAKILQERLIHRRDHEMKNSSWLQLWWNQVGIVHIMQLWVCIPLFSSFVLHLACLLFIFHPVAGIPAVSGICCDQRVILFPVS